MFSIRLLIASHAKTIRHGRMEVVKLRSSSGIAKVTGVALCLAGAVTIAFYTGQSFTPVNHHRAFGAHAANASKAPSRVTWIIGTFLMFLSNVTWSLWMVWQAVLLKEYPNKMLITTVQCVLSMLQSFVVAAVAERDFTKWKLKFDVSLLAVAYTVMTTLFLDKIIILIIVELQEAELMRDCSIRLAHESTQWL